MLGHLLDQRQTWECLRHLDIPVGGGDCLPGVRNLSDGERQSAVRWYREEIPLVAEGEVLYDHGVL